MTGGYPWPVTLRHGGVMLRPLRYRDDAAWGDLRLRNRAWTGPWDSTRPDGSREAPMSYLGMVRSFNRQAREGRMLPWGVWCDAASGPELAGQLTVSGITFGSACWAEAGYWVDRRWAGLGVIPTALALATDHCFSALGLHRMEVAIRPENANSLRVVEKLGFRYEGRRPAYLHVDGAWRDHDVFVLHADELAPGGVIARIDPGEGPSPG